VVENMLSGLNYQDIGGAPDVSIGTISNDFNVVIGRLQRDQTSVAEQIVALEIFRLDRALNTIFEALFKTDVIKYLAFTSIGWMIQKLKLKIPSLLKGFSIVLLSAGLAVDV